MFCPVGAANGQHCNWTPGREAQRKEFFTLLVLYKLRQTPAFKMIINWYSSGRANWETGNTLIGCRGQGKRIHSQKHLQVDFFYTVQISFLSNSCFLALKLLKTFFRRKEFEQGLTFFSKALFNSNLTLSVCNAMWKRNTSRCCNLRAAPHVVHHNVVERPSCCLLTMVLTAPQSACWHFNKLNQHGKMPEDHL